MMQKIQKFGGAMFTPVLLFAFAGIVVGIGTLFTTQAIFGELASPESLWFKCWNVVLQAAGPYSGSSRCCLWWPCPSVLPKNKMRAAVWKRWFSI